MTEPLEKLLGREGYEAWCAKRDADQRAAEKQRQEMYDQLHARRAAIVSDPARIARVRAYLAELVAVGRRHGFVLSHEDTHGAFIVLSRDENADDGWLEAARDEGDE